METVGAVVAARGGRRLVLSGEQAAEDRHGREKGPEQQRTRTLRRKSVGARHAQPRPCLVLLARNILSLTSATTSQSSQHALRSVSHAGWPMSLPSPPWAQHADDEVNDVILRSVQPPSPRMGHTFTAYHGLSSLKQILSAQKSRARVFLE